MATNPVHVARYEIALPSEFDQSLRIALVADVHACEPWMPLHRVAKIVSQTNALEPDLILLLGDYIGHTWASRPVAPLDVAQILAGLTAPAGVFAVFGNHDWRDDPSAQANKRPSHWHKAFATAGIAQLNNEIASLPSPWDALQLAGIDSQKALDTFWNREAGGLDDFAKVAALLDPERPILLMAHEPDIFPSLPDWIGLTLSGHTHGGQILPFGKPLIVPSKFGTRYAYGHYREGNKQLVVSGGLGYSGPPVRIGRPSELTILEVTY